MSSASGRRARWFVRAGQVILVLVAMRLVIGAAVPIAIRSAAEHFELEATWRDLSFSLATGRVEMTELEVRPRGRKDASSAPAPIVRLPFLLADVHVGHLLVAAPHVERLELDGLELAIERRADGTFALEDHFPLREWLAAKAPATHVDEDEPRALDLSLPLRVDALRVQRAVVRVRDASVAPPVELEIVAHAHLNDLGRDDRPASISVHASALGAADALTVELGAITQPAHARIGGRVAATGLRPEALDAYLRDLGMRAACERVSLEASFEIEATVAAAPLHVAGSALHQALAITASVERAHVLVDEREHAALDGLVAAIESVDELGLRAKRVELRGVRGRVERLANANVLVAGLEIDVERALAAFEQLESQRREARVVGGTQRDEPSAARAGTKPASTSDARPDAPGTFASHGEVANATTGVARPYAISIDEIEVLDGRLALIDRAVDPAVDTELVLASLGIENLTNDPQRQGAPARISASASARDLFDSLVLSGLVAPFGSQITAELTLSAAGIEPRAIDPWLRLAGVESTLADASFAGRFTAALRRGDDHALSGSLALDGLTLRDRAGDFGVRSIVASEVRIAPDVVRIGVLEVRGTSVPLAREANGAITGLGVRTTTRTHLVAHHAAPGTARATRAAATAEDPAAQAASSATASTTPASIATASTTPASTATASIASASTPPASTTPASTTPAGAPPASAPTPGTTPSGKMPASAMPAGTTTAGTTTAGMPTAGTSHGQTHAGAEHASLPRFEIGKLAVVENSFTWTDRVHEPPVEVAFQDCGFELEDLALFGDASQAPRTASFHAWSRAADLVRAFEARGSLTTRPGPFDATLVLDVESSGITALRLKPYIDPTGIEEQLRGAGVRFHLETTAKFAGGKLQADVRLEKLDFTNADASIASLGRFALEGLVVEGATVRARRLAVDDAHFAVARDPVGALLAAGLRIPLSALGAADADERRAGEGESRDASGHEETRAQALLAALPDVAIERIEVTNAALAFDDTSRAPVVSARAQLDLVVDGFATKTPESPARFDVAIAVPGSAESISIVGSVGLGHDSARLEARTIARSLRAGVLAAYLPAGFESTLKDGHGAYSAAFEVSTHAQGGVAAELRVTDVELRDAGIERPLFALREARVVVERIDPAAHVWNVATVAARGLELDARRTSDGAIEAFGFRAAPGVRSVDEREGMSARGDEGAPAAEREAPPRSAPHLELDPGTFARLGELELELARVSFVDEMQGGDARPLDLGGTLGLRAPFVVAGADPSQLGALSLRLSGSAAPLARELALDVDLAPFAAEPSLAAKFAARGLRGEGLTELVPSLAPFVDGSGLADGVATGGLVVKLALKKRAPLELDLRGGFGAHVALERCELRASPGGEVQAALDGIDADVARIDLATGDVHVTTVEVRTPMARILRDAAGLHAFGFVVDPAKLAASRTASAQRASTSGAAPPSTALAGDARATSVSGSSSDALPSGVPTAETGSAPRADERASAGMDDPGVAVVAGEDAVSSATAPLERSRTPRGEIRIDELTLRGLDVVFRDTTESPETVLPLTDLQVEVRKLTTRALVEPRVITFEAFAQAGTVPLRARARADNVVAGVFGAVGDVLEGKDDVLTLEQRPVFEDAVIAGRIALFPHLSGHLQADLGVLELTAFEGTARSLGLTVGDGVLDGAVRARFKGDARIAVDTTLVFSELSLDEPKSGPIETYLSLPVPLDSVLFLLRNADGEHRIPVSFTLNEDGLSGGAIASAAAGATGSVLASAVAAAPVRVLSTFTDLFGGGEGDASASNVRAELAFAPGSAEIPAQADVALAALVERVRNDDELVVVLQHRFGVADVERARVLSNPGPDACLEIAARGRQRRAELVRARTELAADARAAYALGRDDEAGALVARLRALDAESGANEAALDAVLDLLKPGAARHAEKRARSAALAVGRARLEALRGLLAQSGIDDASSRIELRSLAYDVAPRGAPGSILLVARRRQAQ